MASDLAVDIQGNVLFMLAHPGMYGSPRKVHLLVQFLTPIAICLRDGCSLTVATKRVEKLIAELTSDIPRFAGKRATLATVQLEPEELLSYERLTVRGMKLCETLFPDQYQLYSEDPRGYLNRW